MEGGERGRREGRDGKMKRAPWEIGFMEVRVKVSDISPKFGA